MQRAVSVFFVSLLLGAWPSPASASSFTFTTIDVPGSTRTDVFGINDAGQIVGSFFDEDGFQNGFRLSEGTLQ